MSTLKDYYDILGVRPTAKQPDIVLAFKGRRTQYHPDKYVDADADTVRWATGKMQEVNEAYAVLSNPAARKRYDKGRQYAPVLIPHKERITPASPESMRKKSGMRLLFLITLWHFQLIRGMQSESTLHPTFRGGN